MERSNLTLSHDDLRRWAKEVQEIDAEISHLKEKREALTRRLEAAALLFEGILHLVPGDSPNKTLPDFVLEVLHGAEYGMTIPEIVEAAQNSPMRERIERNRNGIYNTVIRLAERGDIVRHGKLVYLPSLFNRVKSGKVDDPRFAGGGDEISVPDLILEILAAGKAMSAGELIDELRQNEVVAEKLSRNSQYGYTVLGRMVARKQLTRIDNRYSLPNHQRTDGEDA